jgi:hypothetical protein
MGHVRRLKGIRNTYRILAGKSEGRDRLAGVEFLALLERRTHIRKGTAWSFDRIPLIFICRVISLGHAVALCYKPVGRGFDSR